MTDLILCPPHSFGREGVCSRCHRDGGTPGIIPQPLVQRAPHVHPQDIPPSAEGVLAGRRLYARFTAKNVKFSEMAARQLQAGIVNEEPVASQLLEAGRRAVRGGGVPYRFLDAEEERREQLRKDQIDSLPPPADDSNRLTKSTSLPRILEPIPATASPVKPLFSSRLHLTTELANVLKFPSASMTTISINQAMQASQMGKAEMERRNCEEVGSSLSQTDY